MRAPSSPHAPEFSALIKYLKRVPGIEHNDTPSFGIGTGYDQRGLWWVKFGIDIAHPLAWSVVQEMGYVLNSVSREELLPTVFKPVSPPPYLNGGPRPFLSWVIESKSADFKPDDAHEWLEGRLPRPVEDPALWPIAHQSTRPERPGLTRGTIDQI
jgi:hypothetical protein